MNDLTRKLVAALETAAGQYGEPTNEQRNEWIRLVQEARATEQWMEGNQ